MCALQWEIGAAVVKRRRKPCGLGMTRGAVMRKLVRDMIGCYDAGEPGLMTLITIGVCEIVISVRVTLRAGLRDMGSLEGKCRTPVIECRRNPRGLRVACRAIMRKLVRCMGGIRRVVVRALVALPAIRVLE